MGKLILCGVCGAFMGWVLSANGIHADSLSFWAVMIPWSTITTWLIIF